MLEDVPVGIHRKLQLVVLDRAPDRVAIETDQNGRRLRENYSWGIAPQAIDILGIDGALINVRKDAIESDDAVFIGNVFLELAYYLLGLFLR